jgi:drug/metabolite transporter (DMT)-like permease
VILVALGALCISFAPVLVNLIGAGPTLVALCRTGFAALILAPWVLASRSGRPPAVSRRALLLLAAAGLAFAADLFFWHRSVRYAGAGLGTILANTQVFYLSLIGILFLGESAGRRFLLAVPLAFAGVTLLIGVRPAWADPTLYAYGVVFGLLTGVAYASYILALQQAQHEAAGLGATETLAGVLVCSTLVLLPVTAAAGEFQMPGTRDLILLGALAIGPQILGWMLIMRGLRTTRVSRAGLVLLAQPVLATIWGALFFDEILSPRQIGGAALTILAIGLGSTK